MADPPRTPSSTGGPRPAPTHSRARGLGETTRGAGSTRATDPVTMTTGESVNPGPGAAGRRAGRTSSPSYARPMDTRLAVSSYKETPALRKEDFFKIKFTHLPTGEAVAFEGWVTDFSDNFGSNWNTQTVYGRMDPLATFQGTQRNISIGFDIVSDNMGQAMMNLANVNRLIQFLYPVYEQHGATADQTVLKAGPLIGLKYTNLIASVSPAGNYLVGFMDGVTYNPDMAFGGFLPGVVTVEDTELDSRTTAVDEELGHATAAEREIKRDTTISKAYVPKKLSISLTFTVMHTHLPGWIADGTGYVFGSTEMNGKYPNAQFADYTTSETLKQTWKLSEEGAARAEAGGGTPVMEDYEMTGEAVIPPEVVEADQSEVLEG